MEKDAFTRLISGYREFQEQYTSEQSAAYRKTLAKGQTPQVMMIACCDSHVDPVTLTQTRLGDIFVVRNVANLVPPCRAVRGKKDPYPGAGTVAALEFALDTLKVEHVIILGHSNCGGIRALMENDWDTNSTIVSAYNPIQQWMRIAETAKARTLQKYPHCTKQEGLAHCERESLVMSLANLKTFPTVKSRLAANTLAVHAWYFDIKSGAIFNYSPQVQAFLPLSAEPCT